VIVHGFVHPSTAGSPVAQKLPAGQVSLLNVVPCTWTVQSSVQKLSPVNRSEWQKSPAAQSLGTPARHHEQI
jgi:hypothetical protein